VFLRHFFTAIIPGLFVLAGLSLGLVAWLYGPSDGTAEPTASVLEFRETKRPGDCGATALYIVAKLNGKDCSLSDLRTRVKTSMVGANMLDLKKTATTLGFDVKACRCPFSLLREHVSGQNRCAILHSPKAHFLAVVGPGWREGIRIVDAEFGVKDLTEADLNSLFGWDGAVLLLEASK
jgi:ABC-type bacteriocin/lantibiotic exporter with double-glycine peptidase domain